MTIENKIQEAWDKLCIGLIPSHNRDVVLRVAMQTFLEELVHSGQIVKWKDIGVVRHEGVRDHWILMVTIQPTMAMSYSVLECRYTVPSPSKPLNLNERWNFDD